MAFTSKSFRLVPFVFVVLSVFGDAHIIPQYGVYPRQVTNSTAAPQTTSSTSTPTSTSSPDKSGITSSPTTNRFGNPPGFCPTTYAADFPVETLELTTQCALAYARARDDLYPFLKDDCLREYCHVQWTSALTSYLKANRTSVVTSTRTWVDGGFGTGALSTVMTTQFYETTTFTYTLPIYQAVFATAPCCGQCTLYAKTVDLYFWPEASETATPSVTGLLPQQTAVARGLAANDSGTFVDESGFTFISPSIYIGFTSVGATDRCGEVGTPLYNTTLAFDPTEISSVMPRKDTTTCVATMTNVNGKIGEITMVEGEPVVTKPLTYSDVAQNCSSIFGYYWFSDNPSAGGAGDPCHPVLAIPTKVNQLQKEWNNCGANYDGGFYDPPKTLKPGALLVPTTADPAPTADPGQGISPTTNAPTALPEVTRDPDPSVSNVPAPDPPAPSNNPEPPAPTKEPVPDPPANPQPNPPANPQPNPPAPTTAQQDLPDQPNPPQQGSTTIVLNPPPVNPNNPSNPGNPNPPVITLNPKPPTNPSDPFSPSNPSNPNPPSNAPNLPVLTLVPTVLPPTQNSANPQNPNPNPIPQPSGSAVIIGTQTLQPGSAITVGGSTTTLQNGQTTVTGGTELVLDPQGTQVIVDRTSTVNLSPTVAVQPPAAPVVVTVGNQIITAAPSGSIVIGSHTLVPGSTILVDGTTLSLAPGGSQLVVGESTIPLTPAPQATGTPLVVTLDSTTLTANSLTQFVIDGTTLTAGGTVTASGTTYVLTTNSEGSTMLVAGTSGMSNVATVEPTPTEASRNSTSRSGDPTPTRSESTSGSPNPTEGVPPGTPNAATAFSVDWHMGALFAVGAWALAVV